MEETTKAYIAGLVDGEGSINVTGSYIPRLGRRQVVLGVKLAMQSKPTIEFFANAVGGNVYGHSLGKYGGTYESVIWQNKACNLLIDILPYLITKEQQAKLGILFYEVCFKPRGPRPGCTKLTDDDIILRELFRDVMQLLHKRDSMHFHGKSGEFGELLRDEYAKLGAYLGPRLTPSQASEGKGSEEGVTTTGVSPNNNPPHERPALVH